jgi:hypothetical protein
MDNIQNNVIAKYKMFLAVEKMQNGYFYVLNFNAQILISKRLPLQLPPHAHFAIDSWFWRFVSSPPTHSRKSMTINLP